MEISIENGLDESLSETPSEMVSLEEATDAELDAFLEQADKGKASEEIVEETTSESNEPGKTEAEKQTETPQKTVDANEHAALQAKLKQVQLYADRRSTEIGELRKQNKELLAQLQQSAEETELSNPREAAKIDRAIEAVQAKDSQLAEEEATLHRTKQAMEIVPNYVKPEEMDLAAIKQELLDDGLEVPLVDKFISNIYESAYPETIIHLAKRAHYAKALRQIVPIAKQLYEDNQKLTEQLKKRGGDVLKGVQKELNKVAPITTATSASNSLDRSAVVDPSSMSDAEIEEYLKKHRG
jgi:hypothetical protein